MTQSFLLDTCVCIWLLEGTLAAPAHAALASAYSANMSAFVSPITALEIATLARKRRAKSPLDLRRWYGRLIGLPGMALAEMPPELLIASQLLPDYPGADPYDRVIAATAREYGYTVMTSDRALLDYGTQGYLSVFAC